MFKCSDCQAKWEMPKESPGTGHPRCALWGEQQQPGAGTQGRRCQAWPHFTSPAPAASEQHWGLSPELLSCPCCCRAEQDFIRHLLSWAGLLCSWQSSGREEGKSQQPPQSPGIPLPQLPLQPLHSNFCPLLTVGNMMDTPKAARPQLVRAGHVGSQLIHFHVDAAKV